MLNRGQVYQTSMPDATLLDRTPYARTPYACAEKEATRDAVQVTIKDFLWTESTGLPAPAYSEEDVEAKARDVYRHVHRVYPTIPSPFYAS